MAEGIFAGAVVAVILETVIKYAKSALICKRVCRKLQLELELIRPDVRKIEQQMVRRRETCAEPLEVVERWLARLKEKLTEAEAEVHRCSSGSTVSRLHVRENHDLARKIQSLLADLRKLVGDDVSRATLSSTISNGSSHNGCWSSPDASQYGSSHHHYGGSPSVHVPSPGYESQGSLLHRQMMGEIGSILLAEDHTRQSMNPRRHSIASFDFSNPAVQPVTHAEAPAHHFGQNQHQYVFSQQQSEHYYAPPSNTQHGWFHSSSNGHNVHYG